LRKRRGGAEVVEEQMVKAEEDIENVGEEGKHVCEVDEAVVKWKTP
jgi:hypothetical protein